MPCCCSLHSPRAAAAAAAAAGRRDRQVKHVEGTFVGKVEKGDANLAVVAAPAERGKDSRPVTMYVSDGGRVSASLTGSATGNSFSVASEDDAAKAKGKLDGDSVSGTLTLPDGDAVSYRAKRAAAAAGLYDVTLTAKGQLSGASATLGLSSVLCPPASAGSSSPTASAAGSSSPRRRSPIRSGSGPVSCA